MSHDADCRDILSLPEFEERATALHDADGLRVRRVRRRRRTHGAVEPRGLRSDSPAPARAPRRRVGRHPRDAARPRAPFPILLAPTAYHRVLHPEGEIATARGAAAAGITWIVSIGTTTPIREIAEAASAPLWFQLYFQSDRAFTRDLVQQAEAVGLRSAVPDRRFADHRPAQPSGARRLPAAAGRRHAAPLRHRPAQAGDHRSAAGRRHVERRGMAARRHQAADRAEGHPRSR